MIIAMILAAGTGSRMGNTDKPKQFLPIYNKPLIVHTIEAFEVNEQVDKIIIVTNEEYIDQVKVWCKQFDLGKVKMVTAGGSSRQISVYNGLVALKELDVKNDDIILIHDAARPLIDQRIINDNIKACLEYGATDTVIPATDTIVQSLDQSFITSIPTRSELYQGQTPQTFKYGIIKESHDKARQDNNTSTTDDCRLVIEYGHKVAMVNGSKLNFKITTFDDLMILKGLLKIGKSEVL